MPLRPLQIELSDQQEYTRAKMLEVLDDLQILCEVAARAVRENRLSDVRTPEEKATEFACLLGSSRAIAKAIAMTEKKAAQAESPEARRTLI